MKLKDNVWIEVPEACIGCLLALLLFVSCSREEGLSGNDAGNCSALPGLNALQVTGRSEGTTRTVTISDYPTDQSIGFFVKEDISNGYAACSNREGVYVAHRALWLPTDSIWLNEHTAGIAVYAPYDGGQSTGGVLKLVSCLRPADGSKDIWCKCFTANNTSRNLALTMEHVYTRLTLVVTRDASYGATAGLTGLALVGNEIYAGTTYKILETVPYAYDGAKGFTPAVTPQTLDASTSSVTYDLLLIPTIVLTDDITLTLTVDGKKMQVIVAKEKFASTSGRLEAGKQYNIGLRLTPGKLTVSSVSVVRWDAQGEVDGGNVEYDHIGIKVPESDINLGGQTCTSQDKADLAKLTWAEGNLRQQNDNGNGPTIMADPTEYGHYYTWFSTYTGDISINNTDPCTTLDASVYGSGWRTPSINELEKLSRCTDKTVTDGGMWFMNNPAGLFLPVAGSRYIEAGSGTTADQQTGETGAYWSSDTGNPDGKDYGGFMAFFTGSMRVDYTNKDFGFSVRCVKGVRQTSEFSVLKR